MSKDDKRRRVTLAAVDEFGDEWTFEVDRLNQSEWAELAIASDAVFADRVNLSMMAGEIADQPADAVSKCLVAASRFFRGANPAAPKA